MVDNSNQRILRAAIAAGIGLSAVLAPVSIIPSAQAYSNVTSSASMIVNHQVTTQGYKVNLRHSDFVQIQEGVQLHALLDNGMYILMDKPFVNAMDLASEYGMNYTIELVFAYHSQSFGFHTYINHGSQRDAIQIDESVGIIVQIPQELYGSTGNTVINQGSSRIEQLNDEGVIYGVLYESGTYNVEGATKHADTRQEQATIASIQTIQVKQQESKSAPQNNVATTQSSNQEVVKVTPPKPVEQKQEVVKQQQPVQVAQTQQTTSQKVEIVKKSEPVIKNEQKQVAKEIAPTQQSKVVSLTMDSELQELLKQEEQSSTSNDKNNPTTPYQGARQEEETNPIPKEIPASRNEVTQKEYMRDEEAFQNNAIAVSGTITATVIASMPTTEQDTKASDISTPKTVNKVVPQVEQAKQEVKEEPLIVSGDKAPKQADTSLELQSDKVLATIPQDVISAQSAKEDAVLGIFAPSNKMTRSQLASLVATAVSPSTVMVASTETSKSYSDTVGLVNEQDLILMDSYGILTAITPVEYAPDAPITKQQVAVVLKRALDFKGVELTYTTNTLPYKDSAHISRYANGAVAKLTNVGILEPDSKGNFNPQEFVDYASAQFMVTALFSTNTIANSYV